MVALRCVVSEGLGIVETKTEGKSGAREVMLRCDGGCKRQGDQTRAMPASVMPAPEASCSGPSSISLWAAPLGIIGKQFSA